MPFQKKNKPKSPVVGRVPGVGIIVELKKKYPKSTIDRLFRNPARNCFSSRNGLQ